ncbi:hypothetical protein [Azospirillum brasilense]|uniref:hypothetical protein n=1 Tax=Azospirillum brasilense TaxID=192 RepID=UPI0013B45F5F|nr:hypothetical protein [Azospirillum brasilense]
MEIDVSGDADVPLGLSQPPRSNQGRLTVRVEPIKVQSEDETSFKVFVTVKGTEGAHDIDMHRTYNINSISALLDSSS